MSRPRRAVTTFIQSQKEEIKKWTTCDLLVEYCTLRLKLRTDAFSPIAAFTQHDQEKWFGFLEWISQQISSFLDEDQPFLWVIVIDFVRTLPPPHPIFYVWHCCTESTCITHLLWKRSIFILCSKLQRDKVSYFLKSFYLCGSHTLKQLT